MLASNSCSLHATDAGVASPLAEVAVSPFQDEAAVMTSPVADAVDDRGDGDDDDGTQNAASFQNGLFESSQI